MANYGVTNSTNFASQPAMTTTYTGLVAVAATSGAFTNAPAFVGQRRGKIYDILVGTNGTAADNSMEWIVSRATVGSSPVWVGSVSSVSSTFALDQADQGFASFCTVNASGASSTVFSILNSPPWYVGINQRASYRWVAAPGSEIVWPANTSATGTNGLVGGARSVQGYTGTATMSVLFQEQ